MVHPVYSMEHVSEMLKDSLSRVFPMELVHDASLLDELTSNVEEIVLRESFKITSNRYALGEFDMSYQTH